MIAILSIDWPGRALIPGTCYLAAIPGTATVRTGDRELTVGLALDGRALIVDSDDAEIVDAIHGAWLLRDRVGLARTVAQAPVRVTVKVLASHRSGGKAVVSVGAEHTGYVVTRERVNGYDSHEVRTSGALRAGPIGDWLAEQIVSIIAQGRGVSAYDVTIVDGTAHAASVAADQVAA